MNKSRKLIALLCSLAMIFSVFANFTLVNADEITQGLQIVVNESESDELNKVLDINYVGFSNGISGSTIALVFDPANVADVSMVSTGLVGVFQNENKDMIADKGEYRVSLAGSAYQVTENSNVAKIKVTLKGDLTEDLTVALGTASTVAGSDASGDIELYGDGTEGVDLLPAASVTFLAPVPTASPIPPAPEVKQGLTLTLDEAASTELEKTIVVKYAGFSNGISGSTVALTFDQTNVADVSMVSTGLVGVFQNENKDMIADKGEYRVSLAGSAYQVTTDNVVATIKVTLKEALAEALVVSLGTASTVAGSDESGDVELYGDGTEGVDLLPATYVVLEPAAVEETEAPSTEAPTEDPNATEAPEVTTAPSANPRPTPIVEATEVPVETEVPAETATPVPTAEPVAQGLTLTLDEAASTELEKTIVVKYAGFSNGISGSTVALTFDQTNVADVSMVSTGLVGVFQNENKDMIADKGEYRVSLAGSAYQVTTDNVVATIKVTLKEALTDSLVVSLGTASTVAGSDESGDIELYGDGTEGIDLLPATYVVLAPTPVAPTETPEPTEAPEPTEEPKAIVEVALSDLVDASKASTEAGTPEAPSNSYVTIITDGVYGTDYVAKDAEGNVLTEAEFINKISGYDGSVADAINNITLVVYTEGTEITANLNDATTGTIVDSGSVTATTATPEPDEDKVGKPSVDWAKSSVSVKINKSVDVELKIKNLEYDEDDINFEITSGEKNLDDVDFEIDEDGKVIFTIEAGKKTGSAKIKAIVTVDGKEYTDTLTVNISSSTSGGSSGGTGSNSIGTIAGSQTGTTGGTLVRPDANIVVNFTDLGQAAWAADAINYLAARGIVNGRSATIFDPNADITRAEFAKLVMTVYGLTPPADAFTTSRYTDVAAGSWYLPYIEAASNLGVLTGYPDGSFRPNALVSRQEMAVMMYRATQIKQTVLPTVKEATAWSDAALIGDWAAEAVTALNVAGVMNGTSATTFEPTASATRAQAAQMIYNLYQVAQ